MITRKEFEEGYHEIGCNKFEGPDEHERINAVFRYLDPSGEGEVSREEWAILDQFWKEIKLSIHEFVSFCSRHFGEELANTWAFLDDDGSGEIDQDEWVEAVKKLGYFGPAGPIFNYLDKDDEGTVSLEEFQELEEFRYL